MKSQFENDDFYRVLFLKLIAERSNFVHISKIRAKFDRGENVLKIGCL